MAAPEYVPQPAVQSVRGYTSPPRRPEPWRADRPGDDPTGFPYGDLRGTPGPDQGYVYMLARRFEGTLNLAPDEREADVIAGCVAVALKRASLYGRAPVVHDLTVAFTIWGFLGDAPPDLVAYRHRLFEEVANPLHYVDQRRIADAVAAEVLCQTPEQIAEAHRAGWRNLLPG